MNKKGLGFLEIIVSILIISIASSMFTSLLFDSLKTVRVGEERVLGRQIAETYFSILSKDVADKGKTWITNTSVVGEEYLLADYGDASCQATCTSIVTNTSNTYLSLYGTEGECLSLDGKDYNNTIIRASVTVTNKAYVSFKAFRIDISVKISNGSEVSYSDVYYCEG